MDEDFLSASQPDPDVIKKSTGYVSLLFPPGMPAAARLSTRELNPAAWHDLGIEHIVSAFNRDHQRDIQQIFTRLVDDPQVLRYRLDMIDDLLRNPDLVTRLNALLPVLDSLAGFTFTREKGLNSLHEIAWRVGELQNIIDCIEGLADILQGAETNLRSDGFRDLLGEILKVRQSQVFHHLVKELPELLNKLRAVASITIGVNLDARMCPVQATLLSINEKPFTNQSLLNKLFGKMRENEGIAALHSVPQRFVDGQYAIPISPELGYAVDPMMVPLFADLANVLEKTTRPIADKLKQYKEIHSDLLINLRPGLIFFLGAVQFIRRLQSVGLPVCRPEIVLAEDRLCLVQDSYNANLALFHMNKVDVQNLAAIITNDVPIGPDGRILILTGPNQGGKTTFMQGIGIVQVLAQAGCFVPGTQAKISPVDNIYTHFPIEEKPETDAGRFGEEAMRMGKIFEQVTGYSLVLLNESLFSTNPGESLYLAQDIVRILRRIGLRAIYSTHLHELGNLVAELNQSVPGKSLIISVVSSPVDGDLAAAGAEVKRTYKVEIRPPLGQSYAREIAARYGISYEKLEKGLSGRGLL